MRDNTISTTVTNAELNLLPNGNVLLNYKQTQTLTEIYMLQATLHLMVI